jgi:hypothetical protein
LNGIVRFMSNLTYGFGTRCDSRAPLLLRHSGCVEQSEFEGKVEDMCSC